MKNPRDAADAPMAGAPICAFVGTVLDAPIPPR